MGRVTPLIGRFTAGELSPLLWSRVDLDLHKAGLRDMKNMLPLPHGPARRRQGFTFVGAVKTPAAAVVLVPFEYSTDQAYILAFGDGSMRVFMDGGQVQLTVADTAAWVTATGYVAGDFVDNGGAVYRCTAAHTSGAATEPGVGADWATKWVQDADYEIVTPWAAADLASLRWVQSADTMYLVHPDYAPRKLTRTGHTAWTLTTVDFVWGPFLDENTTATTVTASAATGAGITLTASAAIFAAGHVGALWRVGADLTQADSFTGAGASAGSVTVDQGETILLHLSGTWVGTCTLERSFDGGTTWVSYIAYTANTSFELTSLQDDARYRWNMTAYTSGTCAARVTKLDQYGYAKITAVAPGGLSATATVVETLPTTAATTRWAEGAWSDYRGWPHTVCFHEQRLLFGGSDHLPQTVWGSVLGDFESFDAGIAGDADAWTHQLAGQRVNAIRWMVSSNLLHIGTTGGEWQMGAEDQAVTASAPNARQVGTVGSAAIPALLIGGTICFLRRAGSHSDRGWQLMALNYSLESDAWRPVNISERAEHLLAPGITAMAYAAQPFPVLWMVRTDGHLVSCTLDPASGMIAFADHPTRTGDAFESVAVIPGDDRDEVWAVARREVDGGTVRYVERLATPHWDALEDAVYMDGAITYSGAASATIGGLSHLEGETVTVLADGAVHPDCTVASGQITLSREVEKAQIGLAVTAWLRPMRPEAGTSAGTSQGRPRRTHRLTVGLHESLGLRVGATLDSADVVPFRLAGDAMDSAPELFTGEKADIPFPGGWDRAGDIYVVNDQPLPFTVTHLAVTMQASDL